MSISHRIKSFLIAFLSIAGSALVVTIASPEFGSAVTDFSTYLKAVGVPASLVTLLGLFISEVVRYILNRRALGDDRNSLTAGGSSVELY